jgi:hypothetical protein
MKIFLVAYALLACAALPTAASVVYRINGGTPQPLVDVNGTSTINVGNIGSSTVTVHVYDTATLGPNSDPIFSVGRLVINGTAGELGRLNLLIADGDVGFPDNAVDARELRFGLVDFGGDAVQTSNDLAYTSKVHDFDTYPYASDGINRLDSNNAVSIYDTDLSEPGYQIDPDLRGLIIPDPNLRRATVLAMSVSGDVCPIQLSARNVI